MPNPIISSMVIPVKNASTGEVSTQTFDLPAGEIGRGARWCSARSSASSASSAACSRWP